MAIRLKGMIEIRHLTIIIIQNHFQEDFSNVNIIFFSKEMSFSLLVSVSVESIHGVKRVRNSSYQSHNGR